MLTTWVHCFFILFTFENLVVHGLVNGEVAEQKPKPLAAAEVPHEEFPPKETKLKIVLLNGTDVPDAAKTGKVSINNGLAVNDPKVNGATHPALKIQNATTDTAVNSDNTGKNKTEKHDEHDAEKEESSNNTNIVTNVNGTTNPISEIKTDNKNKTVITPNTEETTLVSDPTTDTSSEMTPIIIASSPETSPAISNSSSPISDTNTSMKPSTDEDVISSDKPQQSEVSIEKKENEKMSSGIIALVMAIVFAIIVIIVYISLLVWRRYLEYRYGNRELLVNDLEFDTNDLRHFEL